MAQERHYFCFKIRTLHRLCSCFITAHPSTLVV